MTRYKDLIEKEKVFAISKFAKELLDVRDALSLAMKHIDKDKVAETEDPQFLKD